MADPDTPLPAGNNGKPVAAGGKKPAAAGGKSAGFFPALGQIYAGFVKPPLKFIAPAILLGAAPLVVIGGQTVQDLFKDWLGRCSIVFDIRPLRQGKDNATLPILISATGKTPTQITVIVDSRGNQGLRGLEIMHDSGASNRAARSDTAIPASNKLEEGNPSASSLSAEFKGFNSLMSLIANVTVDKDLAMKLKTNPALVTPLIGFSDDAIEKDQICRVEERNFVNYLIGTRSDMKLLVLFIIVCILGYAVKLFTEKKG